MKRGATAPAAQRATAKRPPVDLLSRKLEDAQRAVVAVVVALSALALWRPLPDAFMLPKLTAIALGAVVLLALAGVRAVRDGRVAVPTGPAAVIAAAFAAALVVATLTADNVALALVGNHSRYGGLLSYGTYIIYFLVALRLFRSPPAARPVVVALLVAMGGVTAYGLVQIAGLDPFVWTTGGRDKTIFSTMGNTNFAGAYVALTLPVAVAVLLLPGWTRRRRSVVIVLTLSAAAYMLATAAAQAVLAAVVGLAVMGIAWRRGAPPGALVRMRSASWVPWAAGAVTVAAVAAGGLLASRVLADVADSYAERLQFWQAALAIAADHPLVGTGLDSFRDYFPRYRPEAHAVARDFQITDSAHNAFLGMLSNGGLLLGVAYLAFVGWTGWTLVTGLRSVAMDRLPMLAAFGGVWTAYQVQSLVSVDVPPLAFLHFLSAGVIVAAVHGERARTWAMPFAKARPGKVLAGRGARGRSAAAVCLAVVVLAGVLATWTATRPLRADLAAAAGRGQTAPKAVVATGRAVDLAPWEAEYRILAAQAHQKSRNVVAAYMAAVAAADLRSGSSKLAIANLDLALQTGDKAGARVWAQQALERDPHNPVVLDRVADYLRSDGERDRADALEATAERLRTEHAAG